ncbi:hypothetical protein DFH08DRAFT_1023683 [Mycena albidolilacea]|uniref:Uncharacterized protein n=1 Tax=Mycena albidolilacea TaxID=1033008 RepID=A0AAD6ZLE0_9AGAR|nr:hypothetical protein DFH08DRAFT_1023683 [Mycena albidolilacea]
MAPQVFDTPFKDGSFFRASDSFIRKWLRETLRWSLQRPTSAAQTLPDNWEDLCEKSFFRMAYTIKEHDIRPSLIINFDQTGVIYAPGNGLTYAERGSKQKRAFTILIPFAGDGTVLPFQGIYVGSTRSQPDNDVRGYRELLELGFNRDFMTDIVVPYLKKTKECLLLPPSQKSLVDMDVWAVHRSGEFKAWMKVKANHPDIIINYVTAF